MITSKTQLNAVIGFPLSYSQSPSLHNALYAKLGIDAVLVAIQNKNIEQLVATIKAANIGLTVVTMPFKQAIIPFLDKVKKQAKAIRAVNTVINRNGKLEGFNTDFDGIAFALKAVPIAGKNVLLLGAGGAARAVAYYIKERSGKILYLNRTPAKTIKLQREFGGRVVVLNQIGASEIDVIVNATPVGMDPKAKTLPLPLKFLRKGQYVFDLVYKHGFTELLKQAKQRGAKTVSGMDMFLGQALRQIELYSGKKINPEIMIFAKNLLRKTV